MITYIINTSDNKTFDCDQLFRLSGYNKIQWINCSLDKVNECVDFIKNKQGTIVFEQFRLAIIVDFFNYDRIRAPYGTLSYVKDEGVDFSVYLPYIEAYITDNLLFDLEKQEYHAVDCDVYYVKSNKFDFVETIDNLESQVNQIISPLESSFIEKKKVSYKTVVDVYTDFEGKVIDTEKYFKVKEELAELNEILLETNSKQGKEEVLTKIQKNNDFLDSIKQKKELVKKSVEESFYTSFSLYCSENLSLIFNVEDYPYNIDTDTCNGTSKRLFFRAFNDRIGKVRRIRRHFYETEAGSSIAKTAFDIFALSLYLIRVYERETSVEDEGELNIECVDTVELKNLLLTAWNKVVVARSESKENESLYYSLKSLLTDKSLVKNNTEISYENEIKRAKSLVLIKDEKIKNSVDEQYKAVKTFGEQDDMTIGCEKEEFDKILSSYLEMRDKTREKDVEYKYEKLIRSGGVETTNMCPSKQEYEAVINEKYDEISTCLGKSLKEEFLAVSYEDEKKKVDEYYKEYVLAKNVLTRNFTFDIIFMLLTVAVMLVPFIFIKIYSSYNVATIFSFINCALIFAGIFIISSIILLLPCAIKLRKAKYNVLDCYKRCLAKKKVAIDSLKRRYDVDLIKVEEYRHDIKLITLLHNANLQKEKNINNHRIVLETVENCLSGILNNLGIYPSVDKFVNIEGEFNALSPINSADNNIYRIFSLDTIERLLNCKKNRR